jgi:hypothetical protein
MCGIVHRDHIYSTFYILCGFIPLYTVVPLPRRGFSSIFFASSARVCIYMALNSGMVKPPLHHPLQADYLQICISEHKLYLIVAPSSLRAYRRLATCTKLAISKVMHLMTRDLINAV